MTQIKFSKEWCLKMADLEEGHEVGAGSPNHVFRKRPHFQFRKPIDHLVTMTNGHVRVFFTDDTELIMMVHPKHGLVLPRRRRAQARLIGAI